MLLPQLLSKVKSGLPVEASGEGAAGDPLGPEGGKKPLKQPRSKPRRWTRKIRHSSRRRSRRNSGAKSKGPGRGPLATGGIKKSGKKQAVPCA